MANLLTFVDQNADTLQQMALLAYLKEPDVGEPLLQAITTYKVSIFKILNFLLMVFFILASDYGEVSSLKTGGLFMLISSQFGQALKLSPKTEKMKQN